MSSKIDDLIALIGFACILAGVYLLLGLPATLILFGGVLVFVGVRLPSGRKESSHEPD